MSTKFFTNENGNSLLKKFTGAFEHIANMHAFHAVVGYFRASGYFPIREHLLKVPEVKILVGIDVDKMSAEAKKRGLLFFGDPERTRDEFVKWMRQDIVEARYSKEVEQGIIDFMEDIIDKKIEIRVHKTKKLHAKIYIFLPENFNEYSGGEVITGSSNLTESGLGIKDDSNYEFNVALRDYDDVNFAEKEFQKLWNEGEEVIPFDIDRIKNNTHIGQLYTPFEIYIKLLIEYFGKSIEYDPDSVGDLPKNFKKLSYQVDAVNQGYQMLLEHNGFMLADVVGLGKTVIATMIAKRFLISNGTLNSKILVVYPPHLERNWKSTFRQFGIDKHTRFVSNGSLHKVLDVKNEDYWAKEDYDLILVDEAHKFRNHKSNMFNDLQVICKSPRSVEGNVRGARKKIILISATPLNNRPEDIYYQLQLFTDARKSTLSVTNLQGFFAPLIRSYKAVIAASKLTDRPNTDELRRIYTLIREKILTPITVRRTRKDVDSYKDYKKDLVEQGISFPEIAAPRSIEYKMDDSLEQLFFNTIDLLVNQLGYYRYRAIEYLDEEIQDLYYSQAERASRTLAHIMMTQLVKRLESSFHAFKISLNRFRISTERMIEMFEKGKVYIAPDANINDMIDKGWDEEDIDSYIMELSEESILAALKEVKICDPAIGSGAFPMGLLMEIFYLVDTMFAINPDLTNKLWKLGNNNTVFNAAKVKEQIIQNSIYGVDIEKGAVDIARLRFWLSLVVDEETPKPLPNLDYKIVVGDSLLSKFEDEVIDIDWNIKTKNASAVEKIINEQQAKLVLLSTRQHEYFQAGVDKHKQQARIRDLKIEILVNQVTLERIAYEESNKLQHSAFPTENEKQRAVEVTERIRDFNRTTHKLEAVKKNKDTTLHFFDWKLDFPEVMNERLVKGNTGFDIVIGNPPYIQMQKNGGALALEFANRNYLTYERTGDIYSLFYEKGFHLLKDLGIHTFITSSQWLRAKYGKSLKAYFLTQNPQILIELGPGIFENATVDTNILIAQKASYKKELKGLVIKNRLEIESINYAKLVKMPYVGEAAWAIIESNKQILNEKLRKYGKPLIDWNIEINRGILTGLNEAFIIDETRKKDLVKADNKSKEIIRPILRGREIDKYYTEWDGGYVIATFPSLSLAISHYPNVEKYLKSHKPRINQTGETYIDSDGKKKKTRKLTSNKWFETQDQIGYHGEFKKEKIIWKRIGSDLRFSYHNNEIYSLDSTCIATGEKIKYLTALLNSRLCNYQLFECAPKTGMGDLLISVQALEPLLVYYPTEKEEKKVVELLDKILDKKQKQLDADTNKLEKAIDLIVYKFYHLTYEEACLVEGNNDWMIKDAYEKFTVE